MAEGNTGELHQIRPSKPGDVLKADIKYGKVFGDKSHENTNPW